MLLLSWQEAPFYNEAMIKIETERLLLRPLEEKDYDGVKSVICDAETMVYYGAPYPEEGVRRWLDWSYGLFEDYGFGLFAIIRKEDGAFIGDISVSIQHIAGKMRPEIGYHLSKSYWRQGYAKEAGAAILDWLFENTSLNTVYSYTTTPNLPSRKTSLSLGLKERGYFEKEGEEHVYFSITREEWEQRKNK